MFYITGNVERQKLGLWKAQQKRYNADTDADVNADADAEMPMPRCQCRDFQMANTKTLFSDKFTKHCK